MKTTVRDNFNRNLIRLDSRLISQGREHCIGCETRHNLPRDERRVTYQDGIYVCMDCRQKKTDPGCARKGS